MDLADAGLLRKDQLVGIQYIQGEGNAGQPFGVTGLRRPLISDLREVTDTVILCESRKEYNSLTLTCTTPLRFSQPIRTVSGHFGGSNITLKQCVACNIWLERSSVME